MPHLTIDCSPEKGRYWAQQGYNIVAIDVLRATSTIVVALARGAEEVIPCAQVEEAQAYRSCPQTLLAGERKGEIIPGFDYTNSPHDLSSVDLHGKRMVLTTSDGTRLITEASGAKEVLIGTTLNYAAIAQAMLDIRGDWALIGAGSGGDFRPEDKVGCALIGQELINDGYFSVEDDVAAFIREYGNNWQQHVLSSLSTTKLLKIGRGIDVEFVIDHVNAFPVQPKAFVMPDHVSVRSV